MIDTAPANNASIPRVDEEGWRLGLEVAGPLLSWDCKTEKQNKKNKKNR